MSTSPTRPRNPRGEGGRLREQLVQAAAELLDELGDASRLSVRAIARRAGVSPTALYLHFPDREALVTATCDACFTAFNDALLAAASGDSDPRTRLEAMGLAYLAFTERQPALYAVIFSARRPPSDSPAVDRRQGFAGLVALLRECDPALGEDEAHARAIAVWSSLHGFAMLRAARPQIGWPSAEEFVRRTLAAHVPRGAG
jgi:AcrR family transcriptional regulator